MPQREQSWLRGPRERWLHPDAQLWMRPDAANFYKPGTDLADVFPALARRRDARDAAIAAELRQLTAQREELRAELMSIKAELVRRRLHESKYSPSQPRVPAGNPRGESGPIAAAVRARARDRARMARTMARGRTPTSDCRWATSMSATSAAPANSGICFS